MFNDKNIYQTISDIPFNKNQLQLLTRNNNTIMAGMGGIGGDKRGFVGHHSTKKRRNGSSKERQSYNGGSLNSHNSQGMSMLDYSNRQSNKNINAHTSMNPYMFDIASGKKSIKKKSESIDFVSQPHKIINACMLFATPLCCVLKQIVLID